MGIITDLVIALILITGIGAGMFGAYSNIASNYGVAAGNYTNSTETQFFTTVNSTLIARMDQIKNRTISIGTAAETSGLLAVVIEGAQIIGDISLVMVQIPNIALSFVQNSISLLGVFVPSWFSSIVFLTVLALVIFKLVEFITKRDV